MFVKLQTSLAGVNGSHPFGAVIEMEDAEAQRYCDAGLAVEATKEQISAAPGRNSLPGATDPAQAGATPDATPNLDKMTKAQIAAHAAEVHGLELDPSQKKSDLIAAVAAHVEAAKPQASADDTSNDTSNDHIPPDEIPHF